MISSLTSLYRSSIGKKLIVALTGLVLVGFIFGHMVGNLLVFAGPDAINEYGHMLHELLHGQGIWLARIGVFGSIIVHVIVTIQLTKQNAAARNEPYGKKEFREATKSSRLMIVSGLTLLAFFIYHILHFTVRAGNEYNNPAIYSYDLHGVEVHNVFKMVIDGFSWFPAVAFYIIAMGFLCSHLSHGVASLPQTLGINTDKTQPLFKKLAWAFALLILVGNCSIPIAIYFFGYGR